MDKNLERTFLNLLDNMQERIFRICISYTKDAEEAKDLFQEVLVQIWKSLPNFRGDAALSTWVYRITVNVSLRYKTKLVRHRTHHAKVKGIEFEGVFTAQDENDEERLGQLRACVRKLNEGDKAVITLYLEELSYRDISDITGLKENTVAVRVKRIKKKLLDCINVSYVRK